MFLSSVLLLLSELCCELCLHSTLPTLLSNILSSFHHISLGAGDLNHRDFSQECDLHTGGLSVSPHLFQHHTVVSSYEQVKWIILDCTYVVVQISEMKVTSNLGFELLCVVN